MPFIPVLHAEWIKIRTLRSQLGALAAVLVATAGFSTLAAVDVDDADPLFSVFFGISFGQIAAIAFGTTAVSSEFRGGALRLTLAAVPDRGRWFAAKVTAIALPALAVGLFTGFVSLLVGRAALGASAPGWAEGVRGAVGCGVHLTLMALFAAGVAAVLRSGVATLSVLIPFLLIVSFVVGDLSGSVADFLPDRAGQVALHSSWDGALGPWSGLGVTALWTAAALAAGAWSVRRRDA
ncbi:MULTISPECIES: ABC transporter permease [Streptomyces]|uniref:ABC transporter permease n=2 Tax=Streptomyces TaxID=1883 RepID=A0ABW6YZ64_9ACTN|nr:MULTISPECIES: ABC transporter permease [Streptomyces]MCL3995006.1 ABC transporter permease [Streptomyces lavenduligriseus]QIS69872.1 ABC transporter permease [Streptomyces sp. DSM 40868]WDM13899.1 ABC transporter permease [Streptomyces lavenduligriseus]